MNILKLSYIFLCAISISTASANNETNKLAQCNSCDCKPCDSCTPCCDVPGQPTTSGYNQSAAIDVCGCFDFYSSVTFLYIQPMQEQMEYAISAYPVGSSSNFNKIHKLGFEGTPAFKVGIGYNFQYDKWDLFLEYTRVKSTSQSSASLLEGTTLIDLWTNQGSPALGFVSNKVSENWKLNFNIFDLNLGRAFYNGKKLIFKVNYGLKSGFINQKVEVKNIGVFNDAPANFFVLVDSDSWLIGPRLSFCSRWILGRDLSIFGNGAVSAFYQRFNKIHYRESNLLGFPGNEWYTAFNNSFGTINANLEGIIGLAYGKYFVRNKYHFDLALGYELQVYTDQNVMKNLQLITPITLIPSTGSNKPGNLVIHGLNITLKFDY